MYLEDKILLEGGDLKNKQTKNRGSFESMIKAEMSVSKYPCDRNFSAPVINSLSSQSKSRQGHAEGLKTSSGEWAFTSTGTQF